VEFRKHAMRFTRQRTAIMRILRSTDQHPTALQVYAEARRAIPGISMGTVYRLLNSMVEQGFIRLLATGEGPRHYDASVQPHHHVVCTVCGRVDDVPDLLPPEILGQIEESSGYELTDVRLKWLGRCPECRRGRPDNPARAIDRTDVPNKER